MFACIYLSLYVHVMYFWMMYADDKNAKQLDLKSSNIKA